MWTVAGLSRELAEGRTTSRKLVEQALARIADPAGEVLDVLWEAEWKKNLLDAALAKVKRRADPEKFQIFDFYVTKEWPAEKVAKRFGVSIDHVYLAKHRIEKMIGEEVQRLERGMT